MKLLILLSVLALAPVLGAKTMLPVRVIESVSAPKDGLVIQEVNLVGTSELRIGSVVEVIGSYELGSTEAALLGLSITSLEKGGKHLPEPQEQQQIIKGAGDFRLLRKVDRRGRIHLSIYPKNSAGQYTQSTSRLFFLEL